MNASPPAPSTPPASSTPEPETGGPPRLPSWARIALATVLIIPIALTAALPLLVPGVRSLAEREDELALIASAPGAAVTLAAYILVSWALVRGIDRRPFRALGLGFGGRALLGLLSGVGIALVLGVLAAWGTEALGIARTLDPELVRQQISELSVTAIVLATIIRAFILQGIGEEVLFRGYLLQSLRRRPVLAVLIAAVAFSIPHLASSGGQENALERVLYLAVPFGFSISAGFLAIAFRSVWAAVGIHGGFHLATTAAVALGLTADGPGMWVTAGALHALAGIGVALLIPRGRWAEVRESGPYGPAEPARRAAAPGEASA